MKRAFSVFLALLIVVSAISVTSFAYSNVVNEYTVYLDNGYYIDYTVFEDPTVQQYSANAVKTTTGSAIGRLYSASDELIATATVHGTFEYDGRRAEAIRSSYDYEIFAGGWSFDSGRSYFEGATATAEVTFSRFLARDARVIVTLTCSPTGVLS